jgi:hypothetical protein
MAADFSPIQKGETQSFHMDEAEACYFIVQIGGKSGNMNFTIAQDGFTKDFSYNEDERVHLFIRDREDGSVFITDSEF